MNRALGCLTLAVLIGCGRAADPDACRSETLLRLGDDADRAELIVEVADSQAERRQGLMGRTSLGADRGMVFLFEEPTDGGFWMKDTLIPLSIAFWNDDERIVAILDMRPCREDPCEVYEPGETYVGAVEANIGYFDGHGIDVADPVELTEAACA